MKFLLTARQVLEKSVNVVPWRLRSLIRRTPFIRSIQRVVISRFLSGKPFVHRVSAGPAAGARFRVTLPDDKLLWTGTWESQLAVEIRNAVKKGDVCFDVGAYRGFFSAVMALGGAGRVYAFEPNPDNLVQFRDFQALNPNFPIELLNVAVGAADGEEEFVALPEKTMGRLATSSFHSDGSPIGSVQVQVVRLDELVSSGAVLPPSVIKIDVEGSELDVLRGAKDLLSSGRPKLFLEAHSSALARACADFLSELGYSTLTLPDESTASSARDIFHLVSDPR